MIDTLTLKKRIYNLAISGQLTCHLVDDTPVDSTLLFYQEEGVDSLPDIPDTWKYCYFDDVLINRDSERIPVSVADRKKLRKKYDYYGASGVIDKVDNFLFDENLLLIGEDGANLLSRSTPIAFIAKGKYWVNNHAHVLQATEHVLLEFVEIYINAISLVPYVTGSTQPKLSQRMMSKIPVPVPPIEEQQRIVETVRSVSEHLGLIDALQSQYQDNLATLKSKIIDAGIQGKLTEQLPEDGNAEELYQQIQREKLALEKADKIKKSKPLPPISDEEKPFDIPDNWKWVRLADVYEINPKVNADDNINAAFIPMERISAGFDRSFSYVVQKWSEASKNHTRFCDGDVAFAKISPCFENRKSFVVENLPNSLGGGTTELIILRQKLIDPLFTYYLILDERFIRLGLSTYKGTVGQQRIKNDVMFAYVFPLPPLAEQKRIVAKLEELLPLCEKG